jgi:probable HAF family extracellular repeat protein
MRGISLSLLASMLIGISVRAERTTEQSCNMPVNATGEYIQVSYPGAGNTFLGGINNRGDIIGGYELLPGDSRRHAFVLRNGEFTNLDVPGADSTIALDINAAGTVVGYYLNGETAAFVWDDGRFSTWQVPGHPTFFSGINAAGTIAGSFYDDTQNRWQAFLLYRDDVVLIGPMESDLSGLARDVNEHGEALLNVYSTSLPGAPSRYVVARKKSLQWIEPCAGAFWTRRTNTGELAGYLSSGATAPVGAVLAHGILMLFQYPGASATIVAGVNGGGQVVGYAQDVPEYGRFVGFLFVPTP